MRRRGTTLGGALALTSLLVASSAASDETARTPREYRRPADQTYLTFPEWFLVHSPDEYAAHVADHSPSTFPFLGHVGQLWSSYGEVIDATRDHEPNPGYHMMILVIASSTTVEYAIRAGYETLVGRLAEVAQTGETVSEERFGAQVAREYVDFIEVDPWYEFDFLHALTQLWTEVPLTGPDMLRKLERRYALTTEYVVKAGYAWLIEAGTRASYEPASPVTAVVVEDLPRRIPAEVELERLREFGDGAMLITLPRYAAFGRQATALAREGATFQEVAGNSGAILVSARAPRGWSARREDVRMVQPILTEPDEERVVFEVPVARLAELLLLVDSPELKLEHVYDF